jgi:hypothetical protein
MSLDALLRTPDEIKKKPKCKYGQWLDTLSPEHLAGLEQLNQVLTPHGVWRYLCREVGMNVGRTTYERHTYNKECGCFL